MSLLTARQREVLEHRVALAVGWDSLVAYQRDNARRIARSVVAAMEDEHFTARSVRRALEAVAANLEKSA